MIQDGRSDTIQVFHLVDGQVNLTTGTIAKAHLIYCVADGTVTLDDYTGTPTITMTAGDVFGIDEGSVTVATGTFHVV